MNPFDLRRQNEELKREVESLRAVVSQLTEQRDGIYWEFDRLTNWIRDNHFIQAPPNLELVRESQTRGGDAGGKG